MMSQCCRSAPVERPVPRRSAITAQFFALTVTRSCERILAGSRNSYSLRLLTYLGTAGALPFRDFRGRAAQFATTSPVLLQSYTRCEG